MGPDQRATSQTLAALDFVGSVLRQQAARLVDACTEAEAQRTAAEKANQQATWEASRREEAEQRARALERTVDELTAENHRLAAELEALRQTRLFRWTALPRGVYHGLRTRLLSPRRRPPS